MSALGRAGEHALGDPRDRVVLDRPALDEEDVQPLVTR